MVTFIHSERRAGTCQKAFAGEACAPCIEPAARLDVSKNELNGKRIAVRGSGMEAATLALGSLKQGARQARWPF